MKLSRSSFPKSISSDDIILTQSQPFQPLFISSFEEIDLGISLPELKRRHAIFDEDENEN